MKEKKNKIIKEKEEKPNEEKDEKTDYSNQDFTELIKQIESEYQEAYNHMKPKWDEWMLRLRIYNNQKRDKEAIGDPLLFKIHQTVLASLYNDQLAVDFLPREEGDIVVAENLNALAQFDHREMEKDVVDYTWDWDASFFGNGFVKIMEYDPVSMTPVPENIDPMTFMKDPNATSINGNKRGKGACRFLGYFSSATKNDLEMVGDYFKLDELKVTASQNDPMEDARRARQEAQGLNYSTRTEKLEGENQSYTMLEWFTMHKGNLVMVTLCNERKLVVRYSIIWDKEKDQKRRKLIPIEDRKIYPVSHEWFGVSIPDMVEDKQRARASAQNLALKGIKAGLYPMYLYDKNKIKNRADVSKFQFNKFVGIDGEVGGAVQEIPRQNVKSDVSWILNELDNAAQGATATPDIQQGNVSSTQRTATELSLASKGVDTRYSLAAKIFGWSEKRFWRQWYGLYKRYYQKDIDKKIIRIKGLQTEFRPLTRENIIANVDPDIDIESTVVSDARDMAALQKYSNFLGQLQQDPEANTRFALRKYAKLSGIRKDEVDMLLPKTFDEWEAEKENEKLNENEPAEVTISQNHQLHMEVHLRANQTSAKEAHLNAHRVALLMARENPEMLPQQQALPPAQAQEAMMKDAMPDNSAAPQFDTPNTLQYAR